MTIWTKRSDASTVWGTRRNTNVLIPYSWSTVGRPTNIDDGFTGYNTDYKGLEVYIKDSAKWQVLSGTWTVATRPSDCAAGSQGYNTELEQVELWNGTEWIAL